MKFQPIKIGAARHNFSKFECGPQLKKVAHAWFIASLPGYNFINENSQTQAGVVGTYIKII